MITENMTLKQMMNYVPGDADMAVLPLDATLYIKCTVIGKDKDINYNFIRFFFTHEECGRLFKDPLKTRFFDFDATNVPNSHKFITIFELLAFDKESTLIVALKQFMEEYNHDADVFFDITTFDNKTIRLSDVDGLIDAERMDV